MSEYAIEDGIPIPADGRGKTRGTGVLGVVGRLEPGQSVLIVDRTQASVAASGQVLRRTGRVPDTAQYTTRKVEGGVRIWRTA